MKNLARTLIIHDVSQSPQGQGERNIGTILKAAGCVFDSNKSIGSVCYMISDVW
jgi:hypothetical protein